MKTLLSVLIVALVAAVLIQLDVVTKDQVLAFAGDVLDWLGARVDEVRDWIGRQG